MVEIERSLPATFARIRLKSFAFDGVQEVWACAEEFGMAEFPSLRCCRCALGAWCLFYEMLDDEMSGDRYGLC